MVHIPAFEKINNPVIASHVLLKAILVRVPADSLSGLSTQFTLLTGFIC